MDGKNSKLSKEQQQKGISRRGLIRNVAGSAVGAGLFLGSGLGTQTSFAEDHGQHNKCKALARPIPHITGPGHFFFPGPPDAGFDPSTITDFEGVIGLADLAFEGMGTNLETDETVPYHFHTDWRFFKGKFVAIDGLEHKGTLTFI